VPSALDFIRCRYRVDSLEGTFGAIKEEEITDDAVKGKETNGNGIKEDADEDISRTSTQFTVMECVNILVKPGGHVEVSWEGNVINDGIADAVLAVLFTVESSPAAVRRKSLNIQTVPISP
jgi:cleavage and polyadenylation specificity factor subunit 3